MNKIKAVVIDDEVSNRDLISKLITKLNPAIEIIGLAENVNKGYNLILEVKPELVFLDIRMPDGTGFDMLARFEEITFEVVFISGFDSYALKAFEYNALDYVIKPINPIKFAKTLAKVQLKIEGRNLKQEEIKNVLSAYDLKELIISKISIHQGNQVVLLNIDEILSIKSEDKCAVFKMNSGEKYVSSKELSDFEFILENHLFMMRVNKSTYINVNYISSYSKGTDCFITMKDQSVVEIPRRKKTEILNLLIKR